MTDFKLIDVANAKANLQNFITRTEKQLFVVQSIIAELRTMEGKEITKRIATALEKKFPEWKVSLSKPYGWFELEIYEAGNYSRNDGSFDKINMNIGYLSRTSTVNMAMIIEHNQCYLLNESRLVDYKKELDTIETKCEEYNAALLAFKKAEKALDNVKFTVTQNSTLYVRDSRGFSI